MNAPTIRLAAAGAALWLAATLVQANIFVLDRREQHDGALPPYRSVGVLYHPATRSGGTAFLVGRCHVMTAFHVAFTRDVDAATGKVGFDHAKPGHAAEFLIGPDARVAGRFAAKTRARVVAFGRFWPDDYHGMAGDWALLRLDRCLGESYGFLALASATGEPMPKDKLMTAGFPHSRRQKPGITIEIGCMARDYGPGGRTRRHRLRVREWHVGRAGVGKAGRRSLASRRPDPRIDQLRDRIVCVEDPKFTKDYHDPDKRSIANGLTVELSDGKKLKEVVVEYPIGHKRRRKEGMPVLVEKFKVNLARRFPDKQCKAILYTCMDQRRLEATPVHEFVDRFVI